MRYYRVAEDKGKYCIFVEEYDLASQKFQYAKKNFKLFTSNEDALNYILEVSAPEVREGILKEIKDEKMSKLFEGYMKVRQKEDFEQLFDVKLSEESYTRLKEFIDYIKGWD